MHASPKYVWLLRFCLICMLSLGGSSLLLAQKVNWQIQSPLPGTDYTDEQLFISLNINNSYHFSAPEQARIFLDDRLITGSLKLNGNKLHFISAGAIPLGKHEIKVEAYIEELKEVVSTQWSFFARSSAGSANTAGSEASAAPPAVSLSGALVLDHRSVSLSGPGSALRQEPDYTSTVSLDAAVNYKNASIPIRLYVTSNNRFANQSMNFYQVGFRNRWLETDIGDLNPNFDRLILTGVRVRGIRLMFKYRANSIQFCYGEMSQPYEGTLQTYTPGLGVLPTNLINDTQYVVPGSYKRMMGALRIETGDLRENFKIGLNVFKAKDDINSIRYGLAPKDNIAAGIDLAVNMLKKRLNFQAGLAFSILTNDITKGPVNPETLDTTYQVKLDFDPDKYANIITLNTSTIPLSLDNSEYLAYYTQLNYNTKHQKLSVEYRKNGALYASLGNPFLRNNYEGLLVSEKFSVYKKKLTFGLVYQNYSNSLNSNLPARVRTQSFRGNVFVNIKRKWPTAYITYINQARKGKSDYESIPGYNDKLSSFMLNISLARKFWNINHHFFIMANLNKRDDRIRIQNKFTAFSGTFGINENIGDRYTISAEFGKMFIDGADNERISDINVYSLSADWQIKPNKYMLSGSVSNNTTIATDLANASDRIAAMLRFGYMFWRGMRLDIEGGYQNFNDQTISSNDYQELYGYLRYTCNLSSLQVAR